MKTTKHSLLAAIVLVSFCTACSGGDGSSSSSDSSASASQSMVQTPVVSSSIPASPSSNLNPVITGTTTPNASVQLFADSACASTPLTKGQADEAGQFNLPIVVADKTTTTIYALATSKDNRVSICSPTSVTYVADANPPTPEIAPMPAISLLTSPTINAYASTGAPVLALSELFSQPDSTIGRQALVVFQAFNNTDCAGSPSAQTTLAPTLAGGQWLAQTNISMTAPIIGTNYYSANSYIIYTNGLTPISVTQTSSCTNFVSESNSGAPDDPLILTANINLTIDQSSNPHGTGTYLFVGRTTPHAFYILYNNFGEPCASGFDNIVATGTADENGYFTYSGQFSDSLETLDGGPIIGAAPVYVQTSAFVSVLNQTVKSSCVELPLTPTTLIDDSGDVQQTSP